MATQAEIAVLRGTATQVKNESQVGGNTAGRVGGLFEGIVDALPSDEVIDGKISEAVADIQPIVIEGNVDNAPDQEDLTSVNQGGTDVLKFKDKTYSPALFSGLGRVYLRKNVVTPENLGYAVNLLTAEMVSQENTIYRIQYDYDLNGATITLPAGCVLDFNGGSIKNGTIVGSLSVIAAKKENIFNDAALTGTFKNNYLFPEWFGATGDGTTDDTNAMKRVVTISHNTGIPVFVGNGTYLVTDSLNHIGNEYVERFIQLQGTTPSKQRWATGKYGGIKITDGTSLLKGANLNGYIKNVTIVGVRTLTNYIFDGCGCYGFIISGCLISQVGAVFKETTLAQRSLIENNTFLTAYYFSKRGSTGNMELVDTSIVGNYINGGVEYPDNSAFEWDNYNGCIIAENFVDYYRTIFDIQPVTRITFEVVSTNNQYQVFRYFYVFTNYTAGNFVSKGDSFNWNDPTSLAHLQQMTPLTTTASGSTENIPPYIFLPDHASKIAITDCCLSANLAAPVFMFGNIPSYNHHHIFTIAMNKINLHSVARLTNKNCYNNGTYKFNYVETNYVENVSSLPSFTLGWCNTYPGHKVMMNNRVYVARLRYNVNTSAYVAEWVDESGQLSTLQKTQGTTTERPTASAAGIGTKYFDTTLGKPIWSNGTAWVDATGAAV